MVTVRTMEIPEIEVLLNFFDFFFLHSVSHSTEEKTGNNFSKSFLFTPSAVENCLSLFRLLMYLLIFS